MSLSRSTIDDGVAVSGSYIVATLLSLSWPGRKSRPDWGGGPVRHIVLLGAGHAHVEVLRRFGCRPLAGVRLTLITKAEFLVYSGMLPGFVAGHFSLDAIRIALGPLARFAGCTLVIAEATGLDPVKKSVRLRDGREIFGDTISIDCGARTRISDPAAGVLPVKPVEDFVERWIDAADRPSDIAVVGAGAGGVELALSIRHRLKERPETVTLVVGNGGLLPGFSTAVGARLARILRERAVDILSAREGAMPSPAVSVQAGGVVPMAWLSASGLAVDDAGFVAVDRHLRSMSHAGIFAVGDAAGMVESPRPKAGVIAVRQGPVLAANLRRHVLGKPLRPHRPPKTWLSLISTGKRHAVAVRGRFCVEGVWVWYWKRWIDRRFIRRYAVR